MKLKKAQREAVLKWIAEGLESDEINKRAAKHKPRFMVSRQQVDHYRKTRQVKLDELKKSGEHNALNNGLSTVEARVALLQRLADTLTADLLTDGGHGFWLQQVKGIGSGEDFERVEYEELNTAELSQLRGVLDDIAQEMGDRKKTLVHRGRIALNQFDFNNVDDDDLNKLEEAARIVERQRNLETAVPSGD